MNLASVRLLIVDDNALALDVLNQTLIGLGVRDISQGRSVLEVSHHIQASRFDLIIADGEMPGSDGFQLAKDIRSNPHGRNFTTPIMLLSSFTPLTKILRARDAGVNLILVKPAQPAELLGRIQWLASNPRQFVQSPNYCGPDRRFQSLGLPPGIEERRADELRIMAQPERELSQVDIDSMFG